MGRSAVEACATLLRGGLDAYAAAGTAPRLSVSEPPRVSRRRPLPEHRVAVPHPWTVVGQRSKGGVVTVQSVLPSSLGA